ncbi:diguanylate cyclase [Rhodoferax sp.]|uniref:sensor domain-containing diguanylate cyclase n=1 Tax=Rhodoferax sp. TaxID=50421 RepID=UPI0025F870E2|nr:diguanylate cyclase [Rhodoferax sp.]
MRPDNWLHHLGGALLVLVLSLGTTWWLWQFETRNAEIDQRARMDASVQAFANRVEQRMRAQEQVLRGVQGLFSAGAPVGREAFARYVDALQLGADMAGMVGLGWAPLLNAAQMPELEAMMRSQGYLNYETTPPGSRPQYAPLVQLEPSVEPDKRMLGQDLMANADYRAALERARDSGASAITAKLTRPLEGGAGARVGFVMFLPVYHLGAPTATVEERRANLLGWVVAPCRMDAWMAGLPGLGTHAGGVRIFDGVELSNQSLLFDSTPTHLPKVQGSADTLEYLQVAGRTWTLAMAEQADVPDSPAHNKAQMIARNGMFLSGVLALLAWVLLSDRARTVIMATQMTTELRETKEHFELIFDSSPDGMVITQQADGLVVDINKGFTAMTGYERGDVVSISIGALPIWKSADDRRRYRKELAEHQFCENLEVALVTKTGNTIVGILSAQPATFKGVACFVGVVRDITGRKAIEDRMAHMAQHDTLTGLPNRALFDDRLKQAIVQANRNRGRLALLYVDLDHFKPVNDTLGHAVGDVLLKAVAQRMHDSVRASDTVARIGGDEFVVLLPTVHDGSDALAVAEKIRHALNQSFEVVAGKMVHISSSTGVAIYPDHGKDEIALSKNADMAMYRSKQQGRNQVVLFAPLAPVDPAAAAI